MNKKANEAYCYYKQQMPDTVCLFRLEDAYVVLGGDAVKVANCIPDYKLEECGNEIASLRLPVGDILGIVGTLSQYGIKAKTILTRNELGEFDFPDAKIEESERNEDYE